jgi:CHAT domain-containing protein/tetratricopeptide (TPR) repeat protein
MHSAIAEYNAGHFDESEKLLQKGIAVAEKEADKSHLATTLNNLGAVYSSQRKFDQAEATHKRALDLHLKQKGEESPEAADAMQNLGVLYNSSGRPNLAEPLYKRAIAIYEKALGSTHLKLAPVCCNLAMVYRQQGRLADAETYARRSAEINAQEKGKDHPDYAFALQLLGLINFDRGNHKDAVTELTEALAVREKTLGPDHYLTAQTANALGWALATAGNREQAEQLLKRALAIDQRQFGEQHPATLSVRHNLAKVWCQSERYGEAETEYQRCIAAAEKLGDTKLLAASLDGLAEVLHRQGEHSKAQSLLERALEVNKDSVSQQPRERAIYLNALGVQLMLQNKLDEAAKLFAQACEIQEQLYGAESDKRAETMLNVGMLHVLRGSWDEATRVLHQANTILLRRRSDVFATLSEQQKLAWVWGHSNLWNQLLSVARNPATREAHAAEWAFETASLSRGAALDAIVTEQQMALASRDPGLLELVSQCAEVRRRLGRIPSGSPEDQRALKQDRELLDNLESQLALKSASFAQMRKQQRSDSAAISNAIPAGAVLLSFVRYLDYDFAQHQNGAMRYLAFTLSRGGAPKLFDLGPAAAIDAAARALRTEGTDAPRRIAELGEPAAEKAYNEKATSLSALLLKPVWNELKDARTWIVCPDGLLATLPLATLPTPEGEKPVIDGRELNYVSSERDLPAFGQPRAGGTSGACIFADPDFDAEIAAPSGTAPPPSGAAPEARSNKGIKWSRLQGTHDEATALRALFEQAKSPAIVKMGADATKGAMAALSPPRFLHIATHGFYIPEKNEPVATPAFSGRGLAGVTSSAISAQPSVLGLAQLDNPMLRSGLVFAGANTGNGLQAGIATAQELSGLNLWGTELVVLSACETGLGDVYNAEGILGLRRSLLISGARSLMMSLWKVPDKETTGLMVEFYRRKLKGESSGAALRAAMLEARAAHARTTGATHPFYWAAFIFVGDPGLANEGAK